MSVLPPAGWHIDEDTGAWVRDTIHRMGRRCFNWDYRGKGTYLITMTLAERKQALLGRLVGGVASPRVALSAVGAMVDATLDELPRMWPGIAILGRVIMPDHLHFVVAVKTRQKKPLGAIVGSFKSRATSRWLDMLGRTRPNATMANATAVGSVTANATAVGSVTAGSVTASVTGSATAGSVTGSATAVGGSALARAPKLWSPGYVDNILFDPRAVEAALAYLTDNARRLAEKRAHPELFTLKRDLAVDLGGGLIGHFAAIGNPALLKAPTRLQVQCSRRFFAYARDEKGAIVKAAMPRVENAVFRENAAVLLEEAAHGAVLVSPCISEGEREIARRAFAAGARVVTLVNKGFAALYKPSGKRFDACAAGRLLMLAPAAWPSLPGEKKMTREDACVLNWLAQKLAGDGAADIIYKGITPLRLQELARAATSKS